MTAKKIIGIARAELGTKEAPAGSNRVKYNDWYYGRAVSGAAYPWCMTFVQWCFAQAGAAIPYKTASCTALMNWAKGQGAWVTGDYRPGDVLLYEFGGTAGPDHVGILVRVEDGKYRSIEGNTSLTSDDNGGAVMERLREGRQILGAWRPGYAEEKAPEEDGSRPSEWAAEAVQWAREQGLLQGDQYGNLQLRAPLTREELCVLLYRYSKL